MMTKTAVYQLRLDEQEKQEAEAKAKAEAERKDKARKLSYDEVIKLTSERFKNLCDFSLWEQYVSSRSMTAKTKLTKNALNAIYKDFQKWGFDGSNESLKTSITGNYQGLFKPKQTNQAKPKQQREQAWADYYAKRNQQQPNNIIDVIEVQHD